MEWITEPKENGYYWYIDADFSDPVVVQVTEEGEVVLLEDTPYTFEELVQDAPHFWGPIDMTPPEIPTDVFLAISEAEEVRGY
jgi:hypothetical protein